MQVVTGYRGVFSSPPSPLRKNDGKKYGKGGKKGKVKKKEGTGGKERSIGKRVRKYEKREEILQSGGEGFQQHQNKLSFFFSEQRICLFEESFT